MLLLQQAQPSSPPLRSPPPRSTARPLYDSDAEEQLLQPPSETQEEEEAAFGPGFASEPAEGTALWVQHSMQGGGAAPAVGLCPLLAVHTPRPLLQFSRCPLPLPPAAHVPACEERIGVSRLLQRYMAEVHAPLLLRPLSKLVVLALFCGMFLLSCALLPRLERCARKGGQASRLAT